MHKAKGIFSLMGSKSAIGQEIAHYTELENQLIRDKDDYFNAISLAGQFITDNFKDLKLSGDVILALRQNHNAAKYLLQRFFESKGYREFLPEASAVYQTLSSIHIETITPYCRLVEIPRPGENRLGYSEYPNVFHYLHSGVISVNPDTQAVELNINADDIIKEYCSLRIGNKAEEDFMNKAEEYRTKLHLYADTRDELSEIQKSMTAALPRETAGPILALTGIEFLDGYMNFEGNWIRSSIDTSFMTSVYNRIIERFVPLRKTKENKCYDNIPYMEDPEIFVLTGYREPNPTEQMKDQYPDLYGKSRYRLFRENLENKLKDLPPHLRTQYEYDETRRFEAQLMKESADLIKARSEYPNSFK